MMKKTQNFSLLGLNNPKFKEFTEEGGIMNRYNTIYYIKMIILFLLVIAIGLFIFNQYIALNYKAQLIVDPCGRCDAIRADSDIIINWSNLTLSLEA